jgi:signal transduction histidine kinase
MMGHSEEVMPSFDDPAVTPLDTADASFLRSMLRISEWIFSHIGADTEPVTMLEELCSSMCDLVGARQVTIRIVGEGAELGIPAALGSSSGPRPEEITLGPATEVAASHDVEIRSPAGDLIAVLVTTWFDDRVHPTRLERFVSERYAAMAFVVLDRKLSRRHQLQAIAREREVTAGEIHDDPIQTMTAVSLQLRRAKARLAPGEAQELVEQARILTDETIERLRQVMFSLYPETLPEDGLLAALDDYCQTYLDTEGLTAHLIGETGEEAALEVSALAFRLARVALVNVVAHARASTVTVSVETAANRLLVTVADDGRGFDTAALERSVVGHFGIPHARALARWAGGTFNVNSEPGRGSTVVIDLPRT